MADQEKIDVLLLIIKCYFSGVFFCVIFSAFEHVYFDHQKMDTNTIYSIVFASCISWFILLPWILWDMIIVSMYKRFKCHQKKN